VLTLPEAAAYLRLSPSTLYRFMSEGKVPGYKVGGSWRFNRDTIDRWRLTQPQAETSKTGTRRRI
jgi:excisionase family DNA binding protein